MVGIDALNGRKLAGLAHLRQSIRDILVTPVGTRVMKREYGSRLFSLVDHPMNAETLAEIYAATVEALVKWEPRIRVDRVRVDSIKGGHITLTLTATLVSSGEPVTFDGLVI